MTMLSRCSRAAAAVLLGAALAAYQARASEKPPQRGPGVPVRKDPFAPNTEIWKVLASIPRSVPTRQAAALSPRHPVYTELRGERSPSDAARERQPAALPPMRLLGLVEGGQLSAILRVGAGPSAQVVQAVPGTVVEYGAFTARVARIEPGRIVLAMWPEGEGEVMLTLDGS